ncbi:MAG: hypothetical protein QNL04_09730 [SAR324 cluster bacterium]|nr:hypothetical protein [SAR324 cluster bacterium]
MIAENCGATSFGFDQMHSLNLTNINKKNKNEEEECLFAENWFELIFYPDTFEDFDFYNIPSGVTPEKFDGLYAVIQWKKSKDQKVLELDDGSLRIIGRWRRVTITKHPEKFRGQVVSLNIFQADNFFKESIPHALASYAYLKDQGPVNNKNGFLFQTIDSAVFQEKYRGFKIVTKELAAYFRENGNEGFTRDKIPSTEEYQQPAKFVALAKIQKVDTDLLKLELEGKNFTLINVIQGLNHVQQMIWWQVVRDPELKHVALGSGAKSLLSSMPMIGHLIFVERIERIHFFGINKQSLIPLFALISKYVKVTVDGSQAVGHAFKRNIFWTLTPEGELIESSVARRFSEKVPNGLPGKLNCNCRACQLVGQTEFYKMPKAYSGPLLLIHNIAVQNAQFAKWNQLVIEEPYKAKAQYADVFEGELTTKSLSKRGKLRKNFELVQNYLHCAYYYGLNEANRRFSHLF